MPGTRHANFTGKYFSPGDSVAGRIIIISLTITGVLPNYVETGRITLAFLRRWFRRVGNNNIGREMKNNNMFADIGFDGKAVRGGGYSSAPENKERTAAVYIYDLSTSFVTRFPAAFVKSELSPL